MRIDSLQDFISFKKINSKQRNNEEIDLAIDNVKQDRRMF